MNAASPHPRWCYVQHSGEQPHRSHVFDVEAIGRTLLLSVVQTAGEAEPRLVVEVGGDAGDQSAKTLSEAFTAEQAVELRNALMELVCHLGRCDCGHPPLCAEPGCLNGEGNAACRCTPAIR